MRRAQEGRAFGSVPRCHPVAAELQDGGVLGDFRRLHIWEIEGQWLRR